MDYESEGRRFESCRAYQYMMGVAAPVSRPPLFFRAGMRGEKAFPYPLRIGAVGRFCYQGIPGSFCNMVAGQGIGPIYDAVTRRLRQSGA